MLLITIGKVGKLPKIFLIHLILFLVSVTFEALKSLTAICIFLKILIFKNVKTFISFLFKTIRYALKPFLD